LAWLWLVVYLPFSLICIRIFIFRSVAVPVTYILDLNFPLIVIVIITAISLVAV